jgi:formyltetrahydrofolate hydrolase
VSNHPDLGRIADSFGERFRHIPVTRENKAEAEAELLELIRVENVDLVVLARYMQILSDDLCKQLEGKAINIHHSMLPSFKGAKPYHHAHARGVKFVGATAHYVTRDRGPRRGPDHRAGALPGRPQPGDRTSSPRAAVRPRRVRWPAPFAGTPRTGSA